MTTLTGQSPTYQLYGPVIHIRVRGLPIGQGNVRSLGTGRPAIHQNAKVLKPWRAAIAGQVAEALAQITWLNGPLPGPVAAALTFTVPKPKAAPKRRRTYPITRPDLDHYIRAACDAIKDGGAVRDDAQIIQLHAAKAYPLEHGDALPAPGLDLRLYEVGDHHSAAELSS
jgi:Holliday junction resolvase RusA-like endonuclease